MMLSTKHTTPFLLILSAAIVFYCLVQLFLLGSVYPYALLGTMSLLSFSSFLAIHYLHRILNKKIKGLLLITATFNGIFLIAFCFYPLLLQTLWNVSFGIVFFYPILFLLHLVYEKSTLTEKAIYYLTLFIAIFFETTLLFKLTHRWIYDLLTACFMVLSVLLITLGIFRYKST